MQIANVMVALGGDLNNTVPRYGVTAAEIAVLRAIHGMDAVFDVDPAGTVSVRNRDELARLKFAYGNAKDRENKPHVENLYPGAAARVFETLDELELTPEQFVATARAQLSASSAHAVEEHFRDLDELSVEAVVEDEDEEPVLSAAEKAKKERALKAAAKAAKKEAFFE